MDEIIEKLEHGIMVCIATQTSMIHIERSDVEKLIALLKDTQKCGRWLSMPHKKSRVCSVCLADEPYKFADEDVDVYDFCPHCGAIMKNKEE